MSFKPGYRSLMSEDGGPLSKLRNICHQHQLFLECDDISNRREFSSECAVTVLNIVQFLLLKILVFYETC